MVKILSKTLKIAGRVYESLYLTKRRLARLAADT